MKFGFKCFGYMYVYLFKLEEYYWMVIKKMDCNRLFI